MERNRSIAVPEGLQKLLEEFVVACLRKQPSDCVTFAAEYFTDMASRAHNGEKGGGIDRSSASPNANDDDASDDELIERPPVLERRRTVYAEPYDPDDDPNLNERVVHPKSEQQRAWLRRTLDTIFFFRDLERERLEEMLDAFEFREVHASEHVIQQGDDGDFLYIVFMGTLEAYKKDDKGAARLVKEYHGEGYFGELALLYNQPRAATVIAKTDAVLAALDRYTFRRIVVRGMRDRRQLYEKFLQSVQILDLLDPYERDNIADALHSVTFEHNQCIIEEGTVGDCMYFVEIGNVRVTKRDNGTEKEVTQIGTGGLFGELALITKHPRACSVWALGDVKLAVLDVSAFERLMGPCVEVMKRNIDRYEKQLMDLFGTTRPLGLRSPDALDGPN